LDPPDGDMGELMLDGNAIAGLLQEVFAVEMTTAIGTCGPPRRAWRPLCLRTAR
jgi:hypothetical protein